MTRVAVMRSIQTPHAEYIFFAQAQDLFVRMLRVLPGTTWPGERKEPVAAGRRTHADLPPALIGRFRLRGSEALLYELLLA